MTFERTPSSVLRTFGLSVCCETASSASSSGSEDLTSVASWRVTSERSDALNPRWNLNENRRAEPPPAVAACFCSPTTSVTETGSSACSRSNCRTWRAVSPSRTPLRSRPPASTATYRKAAMVRRQSSRVTLRTSSIVVTPASTLARPSSRMPGVRMRA